MLKKTPLALAAAGVALLFSSAAFADPPRWAPAHGWRAPQQATYDYRHDYRHGRHRHEGRKVVVVRQQYQPRVRHVYAPPQKVIVYHEPVYVAPAAMVGATPFGWSVDLRFGGDWR